MMQITNGQVEKYMALYLKEHGKAIDPAKARIELTALVSLLADVHRYMEQQNWPDIGNNLNSASTYEPNH